MNDADSRVTVEVGGGCCHEGGTGGVGDEDEGVEVAVCAAVEASGLCGADEVARADHAEPAASVGFHEPAGAESDECVLEIMDVDHDGPFEAVENPAEGERGKDVEGAAEGEVSHGNTGVGEGLVDRGIAAAGDYGSAVTALFECFAEVEGVFLAASPAFVGYEMDYVHSMEKEGRGACGSGLGHGLLEAPGVGVSLEGGLVPNGGYAASSPAVEDGAFAEVAGYESSESLEVRGEGAY